ncbi:E-selectin-like isoform X2 [Acropora palmata]|uniref:E-selectin-like isoform X2 n=1 Tax=Acropora palmata TaxID=6131 RepID=UPI003DA12CDB
MSFDFIVSGCSGLIHHASFNCSYYTFHENSTESRSWETSRLLCQKSSEGDLVSIEEEEERNFVKDIVKKLPVIKYFIGLKKDNGKWKWLSNQTTVNSSQGKSPWAPGEPSWTPYRKDNCATIYGKYRRYLGRFSDLSCSLRSRYSGHICERAVSCTKHERGTSLTKKTSQVPPVHSTTRTSSQGQPSSHFKAEIKSTVSSMTTI